MGEDDRASHRARDRALRHDPTTAARPEISASWRRVRAGGLAPGAEPEVAPLSEVEIESRRTSSALAPLIASVTSSLEPVVDDGLLLVVTDTDGRVLWRRARSSLIRLGEVCRPFEPLTSLQRTAVIRC